MADRFAIFFAPRPDSLLGKLGCRWHGRNPATGEAFSPPLPQGLAAARHEEIVQAPRHYGFHATLKPPFALQPGTSAQRLEAELAAFVSGAGAIIAPALEVRRIGGFLALTLAGPCPALDRLCAECVTRFDPYRAPESAEKVESRRRAGLTPRQEALLARWGYPYVMEEFRFHMTLTAWLVEPEVSLVEQHLRMYFRSVLAAPLFIDRVALFEEKEGAPLRVRRVFPFER
jgi:putative phosphonate metabolism protein